MVCVKDDMNMGRLADGLRGNDRLCEESWQRGAVCVCDRRLQATCVRVYVGGRLAE